MSFIDHASLSAASRANLYGGLQEKPATCGPAVTCQIRTVRHRSLARRRLSLPAPPFKGLPLRRQSVGDDQLAERPCDAPRESETGEGDWSGVSLAITFTLGS
jgi:hypothetical protein